MPARGSPTRRGCAVVSVLVALGALGCGGGDKNTGQQSFVGRTSSLVLYVTWVRDGDDLTGSLTQGVLNRSGDDVATKRASLTGKIVGDGVTLDLNDPYGESSRLTGTLQGDAVDLEYLSGSSGVTTVHMQKAGGTEFNNALASLKDAADQSKADETTQAAETKERDRVSGLAETVLDDIAALDTAAGASPSSKASSYTADLGRLRSDLRDLKKNAREALAASGLDVCSSAALVETGAGEIARGVDALQSKQARVTSGATAVNDAIKKLLDDYATLQAEDRKYLPSDAPGRSTVNRAIRSARHKVRKLGASDSGATDDTKEMLSEAQDLKTRTDVACRTGGG